MQENDVDMKGTVMPSNELNRTDAIVEYDRSRRFVMLAVAIVVVVIGFISAVMAGWFNEFYHSPIQDVHSAYVAGAMTPVIVIAMGVVLFLVVWYTPMFKPIRRKRVLKKADKYSKKAAKIQHESGNSIG